MKISIKDNPENIGIDIDKDFLENIDIDKDIDSDKGVKQILRLTDRCGINVVK